MRATLRSVTSFDVDSLATWEAPSEFALQLRLLVGPADSVGEESFDLTVCTPGWIKEQLQTVPFFSGAHHLVVASFNWPFLSDHLTRYVNSITGPDWEQIARKLANFAYWEFENLPTSSGGSIERQP